MKLRFYAHYSRYGVKTIWANDGTITGDVYAFTSRKERDEFVENHAWDNYPNWTCRPISRKEIEKNYGRFFVIEQQLDGMLMCRPFNKYRDDGTSENPYIVYYA